MLTFTTLPQAHIVKNQGRAVAPPPRPPAPRSPLGERAHDALAVAIGLWPLTCVMVLGFGLLYLAGVYSSP